MSRIPREHNVETILLLRTMLGSTDAEHERRIRQAARVAPLTERLFREAGICQGQRVLDLGSGVGDVTLSGLQD